MLAIEEKIDMLIGLNDEWMSRQDIANYFKFNVNWVFVQERDKGFPSPTYFGKNPRWKRTQVIEWESNFKGHKN